jgi:hypothetical protein
VVHELGSDQALAFIDASADAETKRSLLSMASRSLADPVVLGRWVEQARRETDDGIRAAMVRRISGVDHRQLDDVPAYIALMAGSAAAPGAGGAGLRALALGALSRLAVAHPGAAQALEQAYAGQPSAQARRQIVLGLCRSHRLPAGSGSFLSAVVDDCDGDIKHLVVDRLVRAGAVGPGTLARWLGPGEPSAVKERVLEYVTDRSFLVEGPTGDQAGGQTGRQTGGPAGGALERAVEGVLQTEQQPSVRALAVRALAACAAGSPPAVRALLGVVRADLDDGVRSEAARALRYSVEPAPDVLAALVEALRAEEDQRVAHLVLSVLAPFARSSPSVRAALVALAREEGLGSDVRGALFEALGGLLQYPEADERLVGLYQDALGAPDPRIRNWGVLGLLMVPMTEDLAHVVTSGVRSLLDTSVDLASRRALARKIGCVPGPPPEVRQALGEVAVHADDEAIRSTCRQALARPPGPGSASDGDLERWYHQVEVEKSVEGIFPGIFARYDSGPRLCAGILKASVLDPVCREKLHHSDFRIDDVRIIQYLVSRDALDDDLCRYCVDRALVSPEPDHFVAALRCRPDFPGLRDAVWRILEGVRYPSELNRNLLLEVMVLALGGEAAAGDALRERALRATSPAAAAPYVRFLGAVHFWPPAKPIVSELLRSRLLDGTNLEALRATVRDLFPGFGPHLEGRGLADD